MHLRLREVLEIGLAAFRREEDVALAPEDNGLRLMVPQERLPFGIKLNPRLAFGRSIKWLSMFQLSGLINSGLGCPVV